MEIDSRLKEQGWHLTEDGLKKVIAAASSSGGCEANDVRKIIAILMSMDFREIAGGALPSKRDDSIAGRIVLQLQKTRNISAPKSNEDSKAAPRFLQLELSDGQTTIQALELENIPALNLNIPPGTKIYFLAERLQLMQGFLILRAADLQLLGGRVEPLVEKWELARTMQKYARGGRRMSGAAGPPPWIPFGKKVETSLSNERNFKSLQAGGVDGRDTKENEEFNAMRSEAIAEASRAGAKKVFGGGGQQMLDHNVKKILEKGYSEEDAKQVLRSTNNNLERALYNLKRRGESKRAEDLGNAKNSVVNTFVSAKTNRGLPSRELCTGKRNATAGKEEALTAKPAGNVSLFDFLTDKLPVDTGTNVSAATNTTTHPTTLNNPGNSVKSSKFEKFKQENNKISNYENVNKGDAADVSGTIGRPKFENTMSSSFAANRSGPQADRQRRERGNAGGRGGRSNHDRDKGGAFYNPFKDTGNERINGVSRMSGGQTNFSNNQNQNQTGRNSRVSYERRSVPNSVSRGSQQESGMSGYASKRGNEKPQHKNHGGEDRFSSHNEGKNRFTNKRDNNNRHQNNNSGNNTTMNNQNLNTNNEMNKLTEATSEMKISDKDRSNYGVAGCKARGEGRYSSIQQCPQNYEASHQQASQNQNAASTQLPNGVAYDTSKIIGFQNKETNEFAMTLLKSQGLGTSSSVSMTPQHQSSVETHYPEPLSNLPNSPDNYVPSISPHVQAPSQVGVYPAPSSGYAIPNTSPAPPPTHIPNHFGMMQGDGWNWKVGDLCFAKYWDDGRYYEAEVTAVSEKTCVVFFLGYGNHEEILKSDCLPITDGNHCPINNYTAPTQYPQAKANTNASLHQAQQMQTGAYHRGGGGSQRYRSERQMYVPPHKREN